MPVTLVYDDGDQSRHPRYRIPATVEIDGWRYPVQEWSLDGFAVAGVHDAAGPGATFAARLWFRFDGFSTVVEVDAEVARRDPADDSLACRFTNLSGQQVAVLRAVIDRYLLGEFVSMDDLIHVVRRDAADDADGPPPAAASAGARPWRARLRRWLGLAGVSALLAFLVGVSLWTGYRRLYVVEAVSAVVTAPVVVVRAPQPSFYKPAGDPGRVRVARGEPLALVELVGGGATTVDSPCECEVLERHVLDGQFVALGEPLMTLLPAGEQAYVSAKVRIEDARHVALGDRATIALPDRTTIEATVARVLYGEPIERALVAPLSRAPAEVIAYHEVVLVPATPLDLALLGVPATIEIDTFRRP